MNSLLPLFPPTVADLVGGKLREALIEGELPDGQRVNEVRLAATLGVSRTPLREALMRLAAEGTIRSIPRRGFFVPVLNVEEIENLYAIRAILDPEALKLCGVPSEDRLRELVRLNNKLSTAKNVARRIALDNEWHLKLVEDCPNSILRELIRQLSARTKRYEVAFLWEDTGTQTSVADHKAIIQALKKQDLHEACSALCKNMKNGLEPIVTSVGSRKPKDVP